MKSIIFKIFILMILFLTFLQCSRNPFNSVISKSVSHSTKEYYDSLRARKIKIHIWQPADGISKEIKSMPLILFSHGTEGSADNYTWLTVSLAEKGFIVVGVDHFNNTWYNKTPEGFVSAWDRPQDVSFVISRLLEDKSLSSKINKEKIAAIGHSFGGYTVMSLAGAIYKLELMEKYTEKNPEAFGSEQSKKVSRDFYLKNVNNAKKLYKDNRIKAVVALEPALGPGIEKESLQKINIPTLIIGCKINDLQSYENNALYYSQNTAGTKFISLDKGEGHFIFIDKCTFFGKIVVRPLCKDKGGIDRETSHNEIFKSVYAFLTDVLKI